jgi:hypothetical protein
MNKENKLPFWTPERDELIMKLNEDGHHLSEMERISGIERKRIGRRLKALNIPVNTLGKTILTEDQENMIQSLINRGNTLKKISNILQLKERTLQHFCTKNNIRINLKEDEVVGWTSGQIEMLILYNEQNMDIRTISRKVRKRTSSVSEKLIELGLASQELRRRFINTSLKREGKKHCWNCDQTYEISEFYISRNKAKHCKQCALIASRKNLERLAIDDPPFFLRKKLWDAKLRAKKLNKEFDLTLSFLSDLFNKQQKRCHYSGIPLVGKTNDPFSISIDRVNSFGGYTQDNVVLCAAAINTMKFDVPLDIFLQMVEQIYLFKIKPN